jgi:hypothetical protein
VALAVEKLGQSGDLASAPELVETLTREIQRLKPALAEFRS